MLKDTGGVTGNTAVGGGPCNGTPIPGTAPLCRSCSPNGGSGEGGVKYNQSVGGGQRIHSAIGGHEWFGVGGTQNLVSHQESKWGGGVCVSVCVCVSVYGGSGEGIVRGAQG